MSNSPKPAGSDHPNIVLIMTDQERYDQIGYASKSYFDTPNLDRLAHRGIIFENAYSSGTVCCPARAALLTGLHHHRCPTQFNDLALREGFWNVAHALRQAGYHTALIGKMHFFPIHSQHGFDTMRMCEHLARHAGYGPGDMDDYNNWLLWNGRGDWQATHIFGAGMQKQAEEYHRNHSAMPFRYEKEYHPSNWIGRETVEFLENYDEAKPFFLISSFSHPHGPYDPPEPYASMYELADAVLPPEDFSVNDGLAPAFRKAVQVQKPWPEELVRRMLNYIRALIKQIDDAVGEILKRIDLDNTVVFFTSDHGDYSAHRGMVGKVPWIPFDDLARVPLFCAGRGVLEGRRVSNLVQNCDFALTCLELAGLKPPAAVFDTQSLVPHLDGRDVPDDRPVFSCTTPKLGWPMVRRGDHKLILHSGSGEEVLIDMKNDPGETTNLVDDPKCADIAEQLRTTLREELLKGIPDLPWFR